MHRIHTILIAALVFTACRQQPPAQAVATAEAAPKAADGTVTTATNQADTAKEAATIQPAQLIIPGQSIGLTRLGEPVDSVTKRLGRPDAGDAAMGKSLSTWYAGHNPKGYRTSIFCSRQMGTDETSRVQQVRITSPWFKTKEGIGVGADSAAITKYYTLKAAQHFTDNGIAGTEYTSPAGIAFELDKSGHCIGIIVRRPGAGGPYLSFHG